MGYILTNAPAILLATLLGLALTGAYARGVRGAGREAREAAGLARLAFVAEGWLACILAGALILAPAKADPWVMALASAVVIWVGFVLPALLVTLRLRGVSSASALADAGLWLAVMLGQAVVLHLVGLSRPPG